MGHRGLWTAGTTCKAPTAGMLLCCCCCVGLSLPQLQLSSAAAAAAAVASLTESTIRACPGQDATGPIGYDLGHFVRIWDAVRAPRAPHLCVSRLECVWHSPRSRPPPRSMSELRRERREGLTSGLASPRACSLERRLDRLLALADHPEDEARSPPAPPSSDRDY